MTWQLKGKGQWWGFNAGLSSWWTIQRQPARTPPSPASFLLIGPEVFVHRGKHPRNLGSGQSLWQNAHREQAKHVDHHMDTVLCTVCLDGVVWRVYLGVLGAGLASMGPCLRQPAHWCGPTEQPVEQKLWGWHLMASKHGRTQVWWEPLKWQGGPGSGDGPRYITHMGLLQPCRLYTPGYL